MGLIAIVPKGNMWGTIPRLDIHSVVCRPLHQYYHMLIATNFTNIFIGINVIERIADDLTET